MSFPEYLVIAVGLSLDAFAVSLGVATHAQVRGVRPFFRLWFHFGLFQFLMTVLGWALGARVGQHVASVDHWIAFGLLALVGGRMIKSGCEGKAEEERTDPSRGLTLLTLAVATSLDAMAVGFSLGMLRVNIWYPSLLIGVVTAGLSLVGLAVGRRLGNRFGKRMEVIGGILLVLIGARIVWTHLS